MANDVINKSHYIGWLMTVIISVIGAYGAMNARLYEVEAKIRLVEAQQSLNTTTLSDHMKEGQFIKETLIRIEGKLDLKQDRFK